ncbi:MAG: hypothetical protein H7Y00_10285 [Fimbriimonadaceae bacterium]|nr:hypothetical protein [Chitinophagales bacterium]
MKKYLKIILPILLVVIGIVAWYGYSEYNRGHEDVSKQKADITINAPDLTKAFSEDEDAANALYLDKAIAVSGTIKSVDKDESGNYTIQLAGESELSNVSCQMDERHNNEAANLHTGEKITVKGTCTGVLMDVVLIRCAVDK